MAERGPVARRACLRSFKSIATFLHVKMRDEILEQPAVLERTLQAERGPIEELRKVLERDPPRLIMLAARGTSDNAAQFGRYLLEMTTGIPVTLAAPSIFTLYDAPFRFDGVLVVAISQSGESTDTNVVLERAREQGARTIGITTEAISALSKIAEHLFLVHAGRERSVAATKTYTGQLLLLYLLAYALGADHCAGRSGARARMDQSRADAGTRHGPPRRALSLHGTRRGAGPGIELRQRVRVCAEADGDLLCGGRALFERRPAAWPHRDAGGGAFRHFCSRRRESPGPARAK